MATSGHIDHIEFHRKDCCIIAGDKAVGLTTAEGILFYNLWSRRGKWVSIRDLLTNLNGRAVPSEDPANLVKQHIGNLRKKIRDAGMDDILVIENQRQSFWADSKYRIP